MADLAGNVAASLARSDPRRAAGAAGQSEQIEDVLHAAADEGHHGQGDQSEKDRGPQTVPERQRQPDGQYHKRGNYELMRGHACDETNRQSPYTFVAEL